jgi:cyclic dehypoxanthinyl futalosine synthase
MGQLMNLAHRERVRRFPRGTVTFVVDTNPNYTNVCVTGCAFCAFSRQAGDADAYLLSPQAVAEKVHAAAEKGATTVLLQGGHHPHVSLNDWQAYIAAIRRVCPHVHIHPFSPAEIVFMADKERCPVSDVLQTLWDAGIRTIPGGGAEILSESVRTVIAPRKATTGQWLDVCEKAHRIGFKTTATMMYRPCGNRWMTSSATCLRLRELQDLTAGLYQFYPLVVQTGPDTAGQPGETSRPPGQIRAHHRRGPAGAGQFPPHSKSSWFSEIYRPGSWDFWPEPMILAACWWKSMSTKKPATTARPPLQNVVTIIRRAGFTPARRDSHLPHSGNLCTTGSSRHQLHSIIPGRRLNDAMAFLSQPVDN